MIKSRLLVEDQLERRGCLLAIRYSVVEVHCCVNHFCPEICWQRGCIEHRSPHFDYGSIITFYGSILFWSVWNCLFVLDSHSGQQFFHLKVDKLSTIVCSQSFDFVPCLSPDHSNMSLDPFTLFDGVSCE